MTALTLSSALAGALRLTATRSALAIDTTFGLEINGSTQRVRMCAAQEGLPPLLVVQAGPGLPLLHEVGKFQRRLKLEEDFLVAYWEQRGCGPAPRENAESVSVQQQADDLCAVLQWLKNHTGRAAVVLGISLGATYALQAAARERDAMASLVAVSPDADLPASDASVASFLQGQSAHDRRLRAKLAELGEPPYLDPSKLQLRARLMADLGCIEYGKTFGALLGETLRNLVGAYGVLGAVRTLRNMNRVQRKLLPELASLNLLASAPRVAIPVHVVFGQHDPLNPAEIARRIASAFAAPGSTSMRFPNSGHMVHFDQPEKVRSVILTAARE